MKSYLGDGVYADYDGYQLVLTTEDGISIQNSVYMESQVLEAFMKYVEKAYDVTITTVKNTGGAPSDSPEAEHSDA